MSDQVGMVNKLGSERFYEIPQSKLWRQVYVEMIKQGYSSERANSEADQAVSNFRYSMRSYG